MATYGEIWGELKDLRAKWRMMTKEEKASSDGLAMERRAKTLREVMVAMQMAAERRYCNDKFRNQL